MEIDRIRTATKNDIAWIVCQEQRPEFKLFIHNWSFQKHVHNLDDPDLSYLIAVDASAQPLAFVILAGLSSGTRNIELVRMAVVKPGSGIGKSFLREVIQKVFTKLHCNRLWLDVFEDNSRARHFYTALGFSEEGVLPEPVAKANGQVGSLVIMSIVADAYRPGHVPIESNHLEVH